MRAELIGFRNINEEDYCKKVTLMIKQIENKSNAKETVGMEKRLVRNVQDKKIAGVCAGLADYLDIDATLVRGLWILFTLLGGSGILAYLIFWLIMPEAGTEA